MLLLLFTHSFRLCSPVSHAVFVFDSLKNCTVASKEAYLATELDRARGCNLEDSNLAAVIENYFEGRVEPVEVASAGAGETTLSLHWLAQRQRERTFQIGETDIV